jgi:excisionase family DNA binding protein
MLTVKQVAAQLGISAGLVYAWVETGMLACCRFGRKGRRGAIRITEADLAAWIESLKTQKEQPAVKPTAPKCSAPKPIFKHLKIS